MSDLQLEICDRAAKKGHGKKKYEFSDSSSISFKDEKAA